MSKKVWLSLTKKQAELTLIVLKVCVPLSYNASIVQNNVIKKIEMGLKDVKK